MFDTKTVSLEWGGKTLTLETGRIARQADGAVLATYGETVVLCAVTAAKSVKDGQDFFPLTVHYQEKFSAAGRIPGGFFKREGRATEKETLVSRLIDRPVRPLFPEGFYNEINVICQVLSYDGETEPDIVAMIAAYHMDEVQPALDRVGEADRVGVERPVGRTGALDSLVDDDKGIAWVNRAAAAAENHIIKSPPLVSHVPHLASTQTILLSGISCEKTRPPGRDWSEGLNCVPLAGIGKEGEIAPEIAR